MHKGMFAEEEPRHLRSLDAVGRAEPPRITCSREFRREFMRRCHGGERPGAIFGPAGLEAGPIGCRRTGRACAHRRGAEAKGAPCLADGKSPARGGMRARERRRASEGCAAIRASRDRKAAGMAGRLARRRRQARTREEEPIASQAAEIAALKAQAKALKALGALARGARRAPQAAGRPERGSRRPSGSGPTIPHPARARPARRPGSPDAATAAGWPPRPAAPHARRPASERKGGPGPHMAAVASGREAARPSTASAASRAPQ